MHSSTEGKAPRQMHACICPSLELACLLACSLAWIPDDLCNHKSEGNFSTETKLKKFWKISHTKASLACSPPSYPPLPAKFRAEDTIERRARKGFPSVLPLLCVRVRAAVRNMSVSVVFWPRSNGEAEDDGNRQHPVKGRFCRGSRKITGGSR
jgi:hypothetical protein